MRFRGKSIRRKIVALLLVPLVSLTALWGFATVITGRQAVQLLGVAYVIDKVGYPVEDVVRVIQKERRQTLVVIGDPRASNATTALAKSRAATDEAVERISADARDPEVVDELAPSSARHLNSILEAFRSIGALRSAVDGGSVDTNQALELYNRLVDPCYDFLMNLHALEDVEMDKQGRALVGITRARETLSREDALVAGALAARNVSQADIRHVSDFVANRKLLYDFNLAILPAADREQFEQYWNNPESRALREAEERFLVQGATHSPRNVTAAQWDEATGKVLQDLAVMGTAAGDRYQKRVEPVAMDVLVQAALAGVLGFIALVVSLVLSVRVGRDLIRDLSRLRKEAHEVSGIRLPGVMRRLAAGEHVDLETEAPRLEYEKDEVGQVGQALNSLQRAAIEAAVKQAELRRGVSEVFVNLARRNQVLLHRQLTLLDTMERRTEDTEELADLFRLDHMTTRMRRHAEGLVILSGAAPSRQWRKPVQLMDVVRAAVAEVEDYERVEVRRLPRLGIAGPAVADVTHLIAELLENATVFSPPHTAVQVLGERVANGFTLEIHDRGLGMTPEALFDANLRLTETSDFELSDTDRLGLFVVSRLAHRHEVKVRLQISPYGGTTAVVFLPVALLTEAPETNGTGIRLAGGRLSGGAVGSARPKAVAEGNGTDRRLPAGAELRGPVELEAPIGMLGLDEPVPAPEDTASGRTGSAGTIGLTGVSGAKGRPAMATLDDETPPNGISRNSLLGLRPAAARPHTDRHADRGGPRKGDRSADRMGERAPDGSGDRTGLWKGDRSTEAPAERGGARLGEGFRDRDRSRDRRDRDHRDRDHREREPLPPTGPVRLEPARADSVRPDGARSPGAVPLPRRRPTPTLVAEHGRRVEPRPVSAVPDPAQQGPVPNGPAHPATAPPGATLPRRIRQASLAPQLKDGPAPAPAGAAAEPVADRDAEDVRRRMSSLQRGWTAGRDHHARQQAEQAAQAQQTTYTQQAPHIQQADQTQQARQNAPHQSVTEAGTPAATGSGSENEGDGR
ncbi:nitrate- and nitrite sensing domain-containing protein [Streptomyces sp. NBC_00347]|uniref:sensor histidine kinase n=1 Tax=Streptomyces sp. NBC_00347 TaxID=2975721 RepID=UPI0022501342|nr:nitrate- and nitrite sensing domain-containing protein [Streptomyces sp. NBC_00347]MCX5129175.1 nitrate- and nitrite sensing domain-containing protein [Streptomyces sp. NBC_00347]